MLQPKASPKTARRHMSTLAITILQGSNASGQSETRFALQGNLDAATAASLEAKLTPALAAQPAQLIFDLAGLKYLTSAGMRLFFMAMKQQKQRGGQVTFVNLQPQVKGVFAIMGSLPDTQIFRDQAELDAYLLARQKTEIQQRPRP